METTNTSSISSSSSSLDIAGLTQKVRDESAFVDSIFAEAQKVIVGQRHMVERVLIGLLTGGHVLLEGVPGLAKTLTLTTLSQILRMDFKRVQFTPDLLPSDLTGTSIWDPEKRVFEERVGPIMCNLLLADEINRAPAKVQSALLEAMQERKVTLGRKTFELPWPFFVMATQNPVEQEGTYPLPEAQMDRFMLKVQVGYPTRAEERSIMERFTEGQPVATADVVGPEDIKRASDVVKSIYLDEKIKKYIVDLVFATREPHTVGLNDLVPYVQYGASPRATLALASAARAHAFLQRRGFVTPDDIKAIGLDVMRHRVHLTFEAEAEEVKQDDVVQRVFEAVPVP